MARPTKQGIDYFPVDVQFDDKVELYVAECGAEGLGILITIWQIIYQNEGYYVKNDESLVLLVRRRTMSETSVIENCIKCALRRGVFDEKLNNKHQILTSKGIQKRYIVAARKKKEVSGVGNYLYKCIIDAGNAYGNMVLEGNNATKEEEEEEEDNIVEQPPRQSTPFKEIIEHLNQKTGKAYKHNTKTTKSHIQARWSEDFGLQDFKDVIDGRCNAWKGDPKMQEFLRPETLFGTKFESYLQEARKSSKGDSGWI